MRNEDEKGWLEVHCRIGSLETASEHILFAEQFTAV